MYYVYRSLSPVVRLVFLLYSGMASQQTIVDKLIVFRSREKFSPLAWGQRGLNPSNSAMCAELELLFNDCADKLIKAVQSDPEPGQLKGILRNGLNYYSKRYFDTEEREFICDNFFELSHIVAVDFKDSLNSWLYGPILSFLLRLTAIFKGRKKTSAVLAQDCTNCGSRLETIILKKEEGIPDAFWAIIQCNQCNEYNLLSPGPNIQECRFEGYKFIEQLTKAEFTEEQAKSRLEQIKYFRK